MDEQNANKLSKGLVVITGSASGIGRALTKKLVERGYACMACDIDSEGLKSLEQEYREHEFGRGLMTTVVDVGDAGSRKLLVEKVESYCKDNRTSIHAFVSVAGIMNFRKSPLMHKRFDEQSEIHT